MKGFFKKLFKSDETENLIEFKVKCRNCSEIVTVTANKNYDLQQDLDREEGGYVLKKEVQDSKCFRIMTLTVMFDRDKEIIDKSISEGEFVEDA